MNTTYGHQAFALTSLFLTTLRIEEREIHVPDINTKNKFV